jgi:hypothetical protein
MPFYETQETTLHETHETALNHPPLLHIEWRRRRHRYRAHRHRSQRPGAQQTMPWRPLGRMDDEELAVVYEYLTRLPGF